MATRLERLRATLAEKQYDALLVTQPENRRYMSGFTGSAGYLVIGAKGGAGTTTVAVNCAVEIARLTKQSTVILDLKPGLGEVGLFLGVRPRYTVLDALDNLRFARRQIHSAQAAAEFSLVDPKIERRRARYLER